MPHLRTQCCLTIPTVAVEPAPFSGFCPLYKILNPVRLDKPELLGHFFLSKIKSKNKNKTAEHSLCGHREFQWEFFFLFSFFFCKQYIEWRQCVLDGSATNMTSRPHRNEEVLKKKKKKAYLADPWCPQPGIWRNAERYCHIVTFF